MKLFSDKERNIVHTLSDTYSWVCLSGTLENAKCVCGLPSTKSWPKTKSIIDFIYYFFFRIYFSFHFQKLVISQFSYSHWLRIASVCGVVRLLNFNNSTRRIGGKISPILDKNKLLTIFHSNVSTSFDFRCVSLFMRWSKKELWKSKQTSILPNWYKCSKHLILLLIRFSSGLQACSTGGNGYLLVNVGFIVYSLLFQSSWNVSPLGILSFSSLCKVNGLCVQWTVLSSTFNGMHFLIPYQYLWIVIRYDWCLNNNATIFHVASIVDHCICWTM